MEPPKKRQRAQRFHLECPWGENVQKVIVDGMQKVRQNLMSAWNRPVNNSDIMQHLLMLYNRTQAYDSENEDNRFNFTTYQEANQEEVDQKIILTAESSLQKCMDIAANHARHCSGLLNINKVTHRGHAGMVTLRCSDPHTKHSYIWSSSPYLPNHELLVNCRMLHAYSTSGLLRIRYMRFCDAANIGTIRAIRDGKRNLPLIEFHNSAIQVEYDESTEKSLLEVGLYEHMSEGINIITDARHGWRRNAKDTSVVAIGEKTHKVIHHEHVTKQDDHVTQRHEALGMNRIFQKMAVQDVTINMVIHDRNMAVNKIVQQHSVGNQNDLWHGIKSVKKTLTQISSGPKYKHGTTWHRELDDKVDPVGTHYHWAVRNCNGDATKLRNSLANIVTHYKDSYKNCHDSARCRRDPNYEPSRKIITNPKAEKLLHDAIIHSLIYKSSEDLYMAKKHFLLRVTTIP